MEGIKLYVRNEAESIKAQRKGFTLGFQWAYCNKNLISDTNFLFFNKEDEIMTHSDDFEGFKRSKFTELSLTEWLDYKPKERTKLHSIFTEWDKIGKPINCKCEVPFSHKAIEAISGYHSIPKKKKKKWKKWEWEWSPCNNRPGEIKIKAPCITSHALNFEGQDVKQILTIECSLRDIKIR